MNVPRQVTHSLFALAALIGARPTIDEPVNFSMPRSQLQPIYASEPVDEGLLFPDIDADAQRTGNSAGSSGTTWMRFENNACGLLEQIQNKKTMLRESSLADDPDDPDESDELDPSDEARLLVGRWLAQRAQIAVVNEGVARSCDDYSPMEEGPDDDEDLAPDSASRNLHHSLNRKHDQTIA